jgi:hypothetical protein
MRSYKKCKTESQAQEKEWKTTKGMEDNKWNGRQEAGMEDNGMVERETDARCSASISNTKLNNCVR